MSTNIKALLWAGCIILTALATQALNYSDSASLGIVIALSGAAWATIQGETGCGRSRLK